MKIEFNARPFAHLNWVVLVLSLLALALVGVLWWLAGYTRPDTVPYLLAFIGTLGLVTGLLIALAEAERWPVLARPIFTLALVALLGTLLWTAPEVWANLVDMWPRLVLVYAVTVLGYLLHARLWPGAQSSVAAIMGISLLPVVLVGGAYLLLGVATGRSMAEVCLLVGIGLSITFFNLGAAALGGGPPLDGGIVLPDGNRLLGDSKTVRGTMGGLLFATVAIALFTGTAGLGLFIGLMALAGDAGASLVKRRLDLPPGYPVPLLDQWDSIMPLLLCIVLVPGLASLRALVPVLIMGTLFVQLFGNQLLYRLGKKDVPW